MEEITAKKNKQTGNGGRFNILDFIIIAFIVFAIVVMVIILVPQVREGITAGSRIQITYTLVFEGIDEKLAEMIKDGQTVTEASSGRVLGTVTGTPVSEPYYEFVRKAADTTDENSYVKLERVQYSDIGKVNLSVTVTASASYKAGEGYTVDGCRIACDRVYNLRFPDYTGTCYCKVFTANEG